MDFLCDGMPSPLDIGPKKGIDPKANKEIERKPDPNEPFSAFVIKTISDPYAGRLTIFKIVSGKLDEDGTFYNVGKETKERFNQLLQIAGKEQKPIKEAGPGNIVAVSKLKVTTTGDTLCDEGNAIQFAFSKPLPKLVSFSLESQSQRVMRIKYFLLYPNY